MLKKRKERANKIFLRFKTRLPKKSLSILASDKDFFGKFAVVNVVKLDEDVIGLHLVDNKQIDYEVDIAGITAFSLFQDDKKVKEEIEKLANVILLSFKRKRNEFTIDDSARHDILENYNIANLIKDSFRKKLKKIFKQAGYDDVDFILLRIVGMKDGKPKVRTQLYYPDEDSHKKNRPLLESTDKLIKKTLDVIKNE